jgi:hypothetical protein
MNFGSRTIKAALLTITVALAVSAVPAAGGSADAGSGHHGQKAILAIL